MPKSGRVRGSQPFPSFVPYFAPRCQGVAILTRVRYAVREETKGLKKDYDKTEDDLKALQSVGQIIGEVLRQLDDERFIVKASSGPRYVVGCRNKIDKDKLLQGTRVSLDMTTLTIMRHLPREVDPVVFHMKAEDPGDVQYSSVGGLNEQIRELREVIELPLINPELFHRVGIKAPKGVLLYGPPGTAKTLLARAVANNIDAAFLKVVASAIVDKYIGESARCPPLAALVLPPCTDAACHQLLPPPAATTCWHHLLTPPAAATTRRRHLLPPSAAVATCRRHLPPSPLVQEANHGPLISRVCGRLIREMFGYAKDHQPCIIFMDEIDAIGVRLRPTPAPHDRAARPRRTTAPHDRAARPLLTRHSANDGRVGIS